MKRIQASTIAEMVIALTIIAICFTVASQVFMQASRSTIQFREVQDQTAFQSMMMEALIHDTLPDVHVWKSDLTTIETVKTQKDSVTFSEYLLTANRKTIWQQSFFSER